MPPRKSTRSGRAASQSRAAEPRASQPRASEAAAARASATTTAVNAASTGATEPAGSASTAETSRIAQPDASSRMQILRPPEVAADADDAPPAAAPRARRSRSTTDPSEE